MFLYLLIHINHSVMYQYVSICYKSNLFWWAEDTLIHCTLFVHKYINCTWIENKQSSSRLLAHALHPHHQQPRTRSHPLSCYSNKLTSTTSKRWCIDCLVNIPSLMNLTASNRVSILKQYDRHRFLTKFLSFLAGWFRHWWTGWCPQKASSWSKNGRN